MLVECDNQRQARGWTCSGERCEGIGYKFSRIETVHLSYHIQEKEEAKATYDDAIASGHSGVLLEQSAASPDVFACFLGNLLPQESAEVVLGYVTAIPLEHRDDAQRMLRFTLPLNIYPRYVPAHVDRSQDIAARGFERIAIMQSITVRLHKQSLRGELVCPTHGIQSREEGDYVVVQLEVDHSKVWSPVPLTLHC